MDHQIWYQGFESYTDGLDLDANPYNEETRLLEHTTWNEGWLAAQDDHDKMIGTELDLYGDYPLMEDF